MKTDILNKITPPGMNLKQELRFYIIGLVCACIYSFSFFGRYFDARHELYDYYAGKYILIEGVKIVSFRSLLGFGLVGFAFLAVCILGFVFYHYQYFRQGSKSIYLMKRLPKRTEIHKRAWTLPLLAILCCIIAAFILLLFYFAIYMLVTPKQCLPPNQWQKLWRI